MSLTSQQKAALQQWLERRRATLQEELGRDAARVRAEPYAEVAGSVPDSGDEAVADLATDINQAELSRDVRELWEVEAALARFADGSYGVCVSCGEAINPQRLSAQPSATRCKPCQDKLEARA